ncbi:MAG: hypothetical protein RSC68_02240 [Acinetobacter sp.]
MKKFLCVLILSTFISSSISVGTLFGYQLDVFRITIILFSIFHFLLGRRASKVSKGNVRSGIILTFLLGLTGLFAPSLVQWSIGLVNTAFVVMCVYYIVIYTDSKADLQMYMKWYCIGCVATCVISIYEYHTGIHIASNYVDIYSASSWEYSYLTQAPTAFLFNPNNIAALILLCLPFGTYFLNKKVANNIFAKIIWYALAIYTLFTTGSRSGIIGGLIICIGTLLFDFTITLKAKIQTIVVVIGFSAIFVCSNLDYFTRQLEYSGLIRNGALSLFGVGDQSRIELIANGLKALISTYFIGCGPFGIMNYAIPGVAHIGYIHMFWVELAACYGIIAFIWFCKYYFVTLSKLAHYTKKDVLAKDIMFSVIIFSFASIIVPTIFTLYFFWFILGFARAYIKISQ